MNSDGIAIPIGPRVGQWLRDTAYPGPNKLKRLMRDLGVAEGTGKDWLAGKRPSDYWLGVMGRKWGWRFAQFIWQPVCGGLGAATDEGNLRDELTDLKARLAALEQRRDNVASNPGLVVARAAGGLPEDRIPDAAQGREAAGRAGAAAEAIELALPARRRSA